jgi:hypothetical protein
MDINIPAASREEEMPAIGNRDSFGTGTVTLTP